MLPHLLFAIAVAICVHGVHGIELITLRYIAPGSGRFDRIRSATLVGESSWETRDSLQACSDACIARACGAFTYTISSGYCVLARSFKDPGPKMDAYANRATYIWRALPTCPKPSFPGTSSLLPLTSSLSDEPSKTEIPIDMDKTEPSWSWTTLISSPFSIFSTPSSKDLMVTASHTSHPASVGTEMRDQTVSARNDQPVHTASTVSPIAAASPSSHGGNVETIEATKDPKQETRPIIHGDRSTVGVQETDTRKGAGTSVATRTAEVKVSSMDSSGSTPPASSGSVTATTSSSPKMTSLIEYKGQPTLPSLSPVPFASTDSSHDATDARPSTTAVSISTNDSGHLSSENRQTTATTFRTSSGQSTSTVSTTRFTQSTEGSKGDIASRGSSDTTTSGTRPSSSIADMDQGKVTSVQPLFSSTQAIGSQRPTTTELQVSASLSPTGTKTTLSSARPSSTISSQDSLTEIKTSLPSSSVENYKSSSFPSSVFAQSTSDTNGPTTTSEDRLETTHTTTPFVGTHFSSSTMDPDNRESTSVSDVTPPVHNSTLQVSSTHQSTDASDTESTTELTSPSTQSSSQASSSPQPIEAFTSESIPSSLPTTDYSSPPSSSSTQQGSSSLSTDWTTTSYHFSSSSTTTPPEPATTSTSLAPTTTTTVAAPPQSFLGLDFPAIALCADQRCECPLGFDMLVTQMSSPSELFYSGLSLGYKRNNWIIYGTGPNYLVVGGTASIIEIRCVATLRKFNTDSCPLPAVKNGLFNATGIHCPSNLLKRATTTEGSLCTDNGVVTCKQSGYYCYGQSVKLISVDCG